MEENKELETTTEEQASVTPAANNGEKKGLFLRYPMEKIPRSMHRPLKNCNCWKTL